MTFSGKIAVITGSGRGIGRRMAMDFAAAGAKVVAAARTAETLDSLIDDLPARFPPVGLMVPIFIFGLGTHSLIL